MAVNYKTLAVEIVDAVGGAENVKTLVHCATRLRFTLKDESKARSDAELKSITGVLGVVHAGGQLQIVIGNKVSILYEEIGKNTTVRLGSSTDDNSEEKSSTNKEKKGPLNTIIDVIAGIFTPALMVFCGAGMLKGLLAILTTTNVLTADMGTYQILFAAADAVFYFMPMVLAFSAAKKFGANQMVALVIAGAMIYPTLTAAADAGTAMTFIGIPVVLVNYSGSVLPIIAAIYVMSKLEKLCKKYIPEAVYSFVTPFLLMIIMVPLTYLVVGPILNIVQTGLSFVFNTVYNFSPILMAVLMGALWQVLVIFGVHWSVIPMMINNVSVLGFDNLCPLIGPSNFSQAGAALGVFVKTRDKNMKQIAGAAAISGVFGIVEPTIYGITLPYRRSFICATVASIAGCVIAVLGGVTTTSVVIPGLLTLPAFIGKGFGLFMLGNCVAYFGSAVLTFLFGFSDDMLGKQ